MKFILFFWATWSEGHSLHYKNDLGSVPSRTLSWSSFLAGVRADMKMPAVCPVLGPLFRSEMTVVSVSVCLFTSHSARRPLSPKDTLGGLLLTPQVLMHLSPRHWVGQPYFISQSTAVSVLILEPEQHCCQTSAGPGTYFYRGDVLLGTSNDVWKPHQ